MTVAKKKPQTIDLPGTEGLKPDGLDSILSGFATHFVDLAAMARPLVDKDGNTLSTEPQAAAIQQLVLDTRRAIAAFRIHMYALAHQAGARADKAAALAECHEALCEGLEAALANNPTLTGAELLAAVRKVKP